MLKNSTRRISIVLLAIVMSVTLAFGVANFSVAEKVSAAETVWTIADGLTANINENTAVPVVGDSGKIGSAITVNNATITGASFTVGKNMGFSNITSNNVYNGVTYNYAFYFSGTPSGDRSMKFVIPEGYTASFEIVWAAGSSNRTICFSDVSGKAGDAGMPVAGCQLSPTMKNATGMYTTDAIAAGTYYLVSNGSSTWIMSIKMTLVSEKKPVVTEITVPSVGTMYVGDTYQFPAELDAVADEEGVKAAVKWTDSENKEVTSFTPDQAGSYTFTATVADDKVETAAAVTATLTIEVKELARTLAPIEVGTGYFMLLGQTLEQSTLPHTLTANWTANDGVQDLSGEVELEVTWAFADNNDAETPGEKAVTGTLTIPTGFTADYTTVSATVLVKNARTESFTFDFANDANLTEEEWAKIPGFSGTDIRGQYAGNNLTGTATYDTYLNIYKSASAQLVYTLPFAAYVTEVEVEYAGGSSSNFNLVVTANYADGTETAVKLATNGNWAVCVNKAVFDSMNEVDSITFTSDNKEKNLAIKSINITYVSLAKDCTITLDVNGGDTLSQTEYKVTGGNSFTFPEATKAATENEAYVLSGWKEENGENIYRAGDVIYPEQDMKFVAQWETITKNTPVTGVTLSVSSVEVLKNGTVTYPETVTAAYGEGKTVELKLTLAADSTPVNTANLGVYELTYDIDNENGFYALGEFTTVKFTVTVYEWKVASVESINLTVKQGSVLNAPQTVKASVGKWNGTAFFSEYEPKEFAVTWENFDSSQEPKPGYTVTGTLTAEENYNIEGFETVTANVEINNFDYSAVQSVLINSSDVFNKLGDYGYQTGGSISFDNGATDEFLGAKLAGGGYITFTLTAKMHVIIGVSSSKSGTQIQFGTVTTDETSGTPTETLTELVALTDFSTDRYQVIDRELEAGVYKIINNATDSKSNVSVTYIQVLDGGEKFFIPNNTTNTAPENVDKADFVGWTDGTTLYTKGAQMPVATANKNIIAYEPYYGDVKGFGTVLNYTLLGYYSEATATLVSEIDTQVATGYTAVNVKANWTNGAALRIAGASKESADDNSALKFILTLEFASNSANLVKNLENDNIAYSLENAGDAQYTLVKKVLTANTLEISLYVEKVASLGLIDTAIAPQVSLNGGELIKANAYTAAFIAEKALADAQAELAGDYKFLLESGAYSRFNDEERLELQKYKDIAATEGEGEDDDKGEGQGSDSSGSESEGEQQPGQDPETSSSSSESSEGSDSSEQQPGQDPETSSSGSESEGDSQSTETDRNAGDDDKYTGYY